MKWILLLGAAAVAAGQDDLTLRGAAQLALKQNSTIEASAAARDAARAGITEARSGMLPKVNYSESWTRSDNPVFVFSSLLTQHQFTEQNFALGPLNRPDFLNNFQSRVTAEQPLYDAGRTKRATRRAELEHGLSTEELRRQQMTTIAQVARFYYGAQLGAEQLKVTAQAMRSATSDLERAESRRTAGMATDADVLSIRVHLARVQEEQIQRASDLDVARAALNEAMGLPLDAPHTLSTPLAALSVPPANLTDLETKGAGERPELRQSRLARDIANTQAADAHARLLPEVAIQGAFEADRQRFVNRGGANWLVSIGLRWNLFNGFADKARIEASDAIKRQTTAEQARAESGVRLQIRQAWAALQAAQQRIETAHAAVTAAEESQRISQNRYEAGLATVTDLLRTETALIETQARHLAAIHDQRLAATLLELAAGTLSAESEVLN
ncbi:MAG: TolC family protein [Acidobacteriota bacterium]